MHFNNLLKYIVFIILYNCLKDYLHIIEVSKISVPHCLYFGGRKYRGTVLLTTSGQDSGYYRRPANNEMAFTRVFTTRTYHQGPCKNGIPVSTESFLTRQIFTIIHTQCISILTAFPSSLHCP